MRSPAIPACRSATVWVGLHKSNTSVPVWKDGFISTPTSRIPVVVIPTNEELMIAREAKRLTAPNAN